jgi:amyotrophic lateral sclerosis 2 protein
MVTPATLLYGLLLPKIYPPLFNLYALFNEKDDDRYWKRIRLWNKQSNVALMAYLGVDRYGANSNPCLSCANDKPYSIT